MSSINIELHDNPVFMEKFQMVFPTKDNNGHTEGKMLEFVKAIIRESDVLQDQTVIQRVLKTPRIQIFIMKPLLE